MTKPVVLTDALIEAFVHAQNRADSPPRELTARQRMVVYLATSIANDLDRGTFAEQQTAALLRLARDAIVEGYEQGLTGVGCEWRAAQEREQEAGA